MFKTWLEKNDIGDYDFSTPLFPKASDREFWNSKYDQAVVDLAERYIDFDWPTIKATDYMAYLREGNRSKQETPFNKRRMALVALLLAETVEYKGRFTDDVINGIFAICEETFWGLSAHRDPIGENDNIPSATRQYIDILAAETAELIAVAYYLLYDQLESVCPEILLRVEHEMERRIEKPYLEHTDFWWMGYNCIPNNWNPWIMSNILTVLLLVEKRPNIFKSGLKKLLSEINTYYTVMPDDGGCDEGCGYWTLAGAKLIEFCDQLYIATNGKINFFGDQKLNNIASYFYRAYIGNGWFVNFADAAPKVGSSVSPYLAYQCGMRTKDSQMLSFAKELFGRINRSADTLDLHRIKSEVNSLIYPAKVAKQTEFTPDDICVLPDLQVSFMRQGDWYYSAKGGHNNESHNHNDIGNLIVFYNNSPVLVDPGCGEYTKKTFSEFRYEIWTMQSGWHCLPVINGFEQKDGRSYCADSFSVYGKKTTVGFKSAYPEGAGLEQVKRTIDFDNGIAICDSFSFKGDRNTVTEHFITPFEVKIEGDCAIIGDFCLQAVGGKISVDSIDFEGDKKLIRSWDTDKMYRIKIEFEVGKCADIAVTLRRI